MKRLPEELEAPDLKLARERKEQRAVEAMGVALPTEDVVYPEVTRYSELAIESESVKSIEEEIEREDIEEEKIVKKYKSKNKFKKLFKRGK